MWEKIFKILKANGIEVYSPSTKTGECLAPYTVIKMGGSSHDPNFSSDKEYYIVMCYVPYNKYSKLEGYKNQVKQVLKGLYPMIKEAGTETPSYYDDTYKAHMVSITYVNYKKR